MSSRTTHSDSISHGPQDCQKCKTRRIKCDRALPACAKCTKRHYECPGYDNKLRWANAIAIRGRFKGMQFPSADDEQPTPGPEMDMHQEPSQGSGYLMDDSSYTADRNLAPSFPSDATVAQLLDHYDKNIAGLMVWLDSEHNAYRRLVLPLAHRQPGLMLSILAISAKHISASGEMDSGFSKSACDAAVLTITESVQQVTSRLAESYDFSTERDMETAEWMLASMLTLSGYEMMGSNSMNWETHRQAARTLVNVLGTADRCDNELYTFLRNQLSILDVLACTTNFDLGVTDGVILPETARGDVIFGEFLKTIHSVTSKSRERLQEKHHEVDSSSAGNITSKELCSSFEMARGSTLMAAGSLPFDDTSRKRDFIRMVEIYHHAGLLYSYRSLHLSDSDPSAVHYSSKRLFEILDDFENGLAWVQNFPWPVFVLGTESHGDIPKQTFVRAVYRMIIQNMGSGHFEAVLQFLEEFWAGQDSEWSTRAREWELRGIRILAV
ncbi:fungal-specific transcription factor domain-containing protein [Leptodontidium sp. MPI-SDFR-AT-0119]|nr:fungal-specific transcription factor domain-containing protein [Leptodontidium sp. MPI-SDFR-AT-0119]